MDGSPRRESSPTNRCINTTSASPSRHRRRAPLSFIPHTTATVGPVRFVQGFAVRTTTNGSPARSTRVLVSVQRSSRTDSLVQRNPIRSLSLPPQYACCSRATSSVRKRCPHPRPCVEGGEGRLQPGELRHRADPAADRAAEPLCSVASVPRNISAPP